MAWYDKQKAILGKYRRWSLIPDEEYRSLLHRVTGCTTSTDGSLTQADFDWFMAELEASFEYRIQEGFCPAPPVTVDRHYWRCRLAKNGEANSRMRHLLDRLWQELKTMLPPEDRDTAYLRAIAAQANRRRVETIADLKGWQICVVIEALKARIFQERRRLSANRAGLPGAVPDPAGVPQATGPGTAPRIDVSPLIPADTEDASPDPLLPCAAIIGSSDEVPF